MCEVPLFSACSDRAMVMTGLNTGFCTEAHSIVRPVNEQSSLFLSVPQSRRRAFLLSLPLSLSVGGETTGRNSRSPCVLHPFLSQVETVEGQWY